MKTQVLTTVKAPQKTAAPLSLAEVADLITVQPPTNRTVVQVLDEALRRMQNFPGVHLQGACECHTLKAFESMAALVAEAREMLAPGSQHFSSRQASVQEAVDARGMLA